MPTRCDDVAAAAAARSRRIPAPVCWRGALNCRGALPWSDILLRPRACTIGWLLSVVHSRGRTDGRSPLRHVAGQKKIRFENEKYLRAHPELAQVRMWLCARVWYHAWAALPLRFCDSCSCGAATRC